LSSNDGAVVLRWTLDGHGIAIRSEWEIEQHVRSGDLVKLLPDWSLPNADIFAVYLEGHQLSARLRSFIDFLAASLPRMMGLAVSTGDPNGGRA
jgi:DNA-binding transcriptional LysR family regulator